MNPPASVCVRETNTDSQGILVLRGASRWERGIRHSSRVPTENWLKEQKLQKDAEASEKDDELLINGLKIADVLELPEENTDQTTGTNYSA